jgi:hemolysin type calcium-binding protein
MRRRRIVAGSLLTVPLVILAMASPSSAASHGRDHGHRPAPKPVVRCQGHKATIIVTTSSPHLVRGTARRDVIAVLAAGHVVDAGAGNDLVCGSAGADVVRGGAGNDVLLGGDGNDVVDGNQGNDVGLLGAGDDTFRWDPGDGSDVVEGQDGTDTMLFNGAPTTDNVTLSPNGGRLDFFRVQGTIHMDTNDVEIVDFNALAGADTVLVNDLTGTDVTQTNLDLGGTDGAVDSVDVNGTDGVDNLNIQGNGSDVDVTGLATADSIKNAEPTDHLNVHTLAGADNVAQNVGGLIQLLVD